MDYERIMEALEIKEIWPPKKIGKNKFCAIVYNDYGQYLKSITSDYELKSVLFGPYPKRIYKLKTTDFDRINDQIRAAKSFI